MAVLAGLILMAAAGAGARPLAGGSAGTLSVAGRSGAWVALGVLAALLGAAGALLVLVRPGFLRHRPEDQLAPLPRARWWEQALAVVLATAALALVPLLLLTAHRTGSHAPPALQSPSRQAPAAESRPSPGGADVPSSVIVFAGAGLAAFAAASVWVRRVGRPRGREQSHDDAPPVAAAVAAGARAIEGPADDREAILAAYEAMREVLVAHGTRIEASDAPRELLRRAAAGAPAHAAGPLHALTVLFERARFSPAEPGPEDREAAVRALGTLRAAW